jgi:predicted nucleic acid-binding protein
VRRVGAALFIVLALASCGSTKPSISKDAAAQLQAKVSEIRVLAAARHASQVAAKLAELRVQVDQLRQAGDLTSPAAQAILDAAAAVEQNLPLITTTTTTSAPVPPGRAKHEDDRSDDQGD